MTLQGANIRIGASLILMSFALILTIYNNSPVVPLSNDVSHIILRQIVSEIQAVKADQFINSTTPSVTSWQPWNGCCLLETVACYSMLNNAKLCIIAGAPRPLQINAAIKPRVRANLNIWNTTHPTCRCSMAFFGKTKIFFSKMFGFRTASTKPCFLGAVCLKTLRLHLDVDVISHAFVKMCWTVQCSKTSVDCRWNFAKNNYKTPQTNLV